MVVCVQVRMSAGVRRHALRAERERLPDEPVREQLDLPRQGRGVRVPLPARLRGQVLSEQDRLLLGQHQPLRERGQVSGPVHPLHLRLSTGVQVSRVTNPLQLVMSSSYEQGQGPNKAANVQFI